MKAGGEAEQVFQPAARHNDVLIELGQAGVAQGVGKFAADFPDGLALVGPEADIHEERVMGADDFFQSLDLAGDGFFLAVQLHDEVRAAAEEAQALSTFGGGGEGEFIRQFQRAGEKAGGEDGLQGAHGVLHGGPRTR